MQLPSLTPQLIFPLLLITGVATAMSDPVVVTNETRKVHLSHSQGCANNQSVTAPDGSEFTEQLASDLLCENLQGHDTTSQNSTVTGAFAGSGDSAISLEAIDDHWVMQSTYSRYFVAFEVNEPQRFELTASLSAVAENPGGYQAAKAVLHFKSLDSTIHFTNLSLWGQSGSLSEEIDLQGVLEPGLYTLKVEADNYMDLVVLAGNAAESVSNYEFELSFPDLTGTPGDLTGDGIVGIPDLLILIGAWGDCADCDDCPADLTGDCAVGVADLLILISNWG